MCGIVGQVRLDRATPERGVLERMCRALEHRGPDSRGLHSGAGVGLGIQRLRIIDLVTGDQPIYNEDRSVVVVLNGEIYNFRELRQELEQRGHRFATGSDTEVIVHLYEEHGPACVEHLHGMFGLAVWDANRNRLVLARDRVGKKPLFYALRDGRLSFASELSALMQDTTIPRNLDPQALDAYFAFRYIPSPMSAYAAVRKLPPAHRLVLDPDGARVERYWKLDFSQRAEGGDEELVEGIREHLIAATRRRLISDVPLGAFLSGGVDSAAVVAAMAESASGRVKTFSIGFDDPRLDERAPARLVAGHFDTEHHELLVEPDAVSLIPRIVRHYGEPFADATAVPTFYLAEMARRDVTVALNGDGGDEIFGGYPRYVVNAGAGRLDAVPLALRRAIARAAVLVPPSGRIDSTRSRLRRLGSTVALDPFERYLRYMTDLQGTPRTGLYTPEFAEQVRPEAATQVLRGPWEDSRARNLVDRMLDVDSQTYLPDDLLAKVDIATMACSLEGRSPLLDHELMQYAASLPPHLKVDGREKKVGLRQALRGWVPDTILDAPKRGFQPPLALWFRGDLREMAREVLLDPVARDRGYVRADAVAGLLDAHAAGRADNSQAIWTLLMFESWMREAVDGRQATSASSDSICAAERATS